MKLRYRILQNYYSDKDKKKITFHEDEKLESKHFRFILLLMELYRQFL